jgi:hypothetical protein
MIFLKSYWFDTFEGFPKNNSKKDNRTSNLKEGHLKDTDKIWMKILIVIFQSRNC